MTTRATNHEIESLSAYLDEQVSASERARIDQMLQQDAEMQEVLNDLRQLRTLLRSQPHPRAPRNFMLTPAILGEQRLKTVKITWFQRMRLVSALASMAFVLVLLGDLLGLGGRVAAPLIASAPEMDAAPALTQEYALQREAAPEAAAPLEVPAESGTGALEGQITQVVEESLPAAKMVAPPEATPEASPEALLAMEAAPYPLPTSDAGVPTVPDENLPPASAKMAPEPSATPGASPVAQTEPEALALGELEDSSASAPAAEQGQRVPAPSFAWNSLRLAALALAILAVVSGLISYVFWQKSRV